MLRSLRLSRSLMASVPRQLPTTASVSRRSIATTNSRQADLVQDLYLREIRTYKPAPVKPSDADSHVHKFSIPSPPPSPEEANLSADLKSYEEQQVEVEGQQAASASTDGPEPVQEDWFEDDWEDETPAAH